VGFVSLLDENRVGALVAVLLAALASCIALAVPARAEGDEPYTVANYPVDAVAADAVTAKQKALAEGQQAAFRSLLKRLVPVTAYDQLSRLKSVKATEFLDGVVVRDERTSATQYVATLDFSFQPDAVRNLLTREGVPFTDEQAPQIVIVPVYVPPQPGKGPEPASLSAPRGSQMWKEVWAGLDLKYALTPVKLADVKPELTGDVIQKLINGDGTALSTLKEIYGSSLVVLAVAQPDLAKQRLNVSLAGRDAVGAFVLNRSYRLCLDDVAYTGETAAVISLGIIEGRWKETKVASTSQARGGYGAGAEQVHLIVEFRNMQQWQQLYGWLSRLPGMEGMEVGGLTARSAELVAYYPGGDQALASVLAKQGFDVRQLGGALLISPAL